VEKTVKLTLHGKLGALNTLARIFNMIRERRETAGRIGILDLARIANEPDDFDYYDSMPELQGDRAPRDGLD